MMAAAIANCYEIYSPQSTSPLTPTCLALSSERTSLVLVARPAPIAVFRQAQLTHWELMYAWDRHSSPPAPAQWLPGVLPPHRPPTNQLYIFMLDQQPETHIRFWQATPRLK